MVKCLPIVSVLLESFSAGFTNVSRCFLDETKTGFQVGVWLYTVYTMEWSSLDFFPQIIHPYFDLFTLSVTFTIKVSTHTCKRRNNFVCTAIARNFVLVFEEWREFERSLCAGTYQRLHSSKLKSGACADRMPLCWCNVYWYILKQWIALKTRSDWLVKLRISCAIYLRATWQKMAPGLHPWQAKKSRKLTKKQSLKTQKGRV